MYLRNVVEQHKVYGSIKWKYSNNFLRVFTQVQLLCVLQDANYINEHATDV